MEITIGVQNVGRELTLDTERTADEVAADVEAAIKAGKPLVLKDDKGRHLVIPSGALGYIEFGGDESRKVGFHNV